MSALSRDVHCFWFCSTTQKQRLLKESRKIDAKIRENTPTCDVGTSGSPGRTALGGVSSLSRKCSSLQQEARCLSNLALFFDWVGGSDRVMSAPSRVFIVFDSARRHKISDYSKKYSKKALKFVVRRPRFAPLYVPRQREPREVEWPGHTQVCTLLYAD